MQKEHVQKIIDKICTDVENLFGCSPKVSRASVVKAIPNFILLLELLSQGTENEERINKLLQQYYAEDTYKDGLRALSHKAYELLFVGKSSSYNSRRELFGKILNQIGYNGDDFEEQHKLYKYIYDRHQGINYRPSKELAIKLCKYLGLDVAVYLPSKGEYRDYLIQRQQELLKLLNVEPEIIPDLKYQGMTSDMKETLFLKFSKFIEQISNDAWEDKIDRDELCSETQSLTTELMEYRKVANC